MKTVSVVAAVIKDKTEYLPQPEDMENTKVGGSSPEER